MTERAATNAQMAVGRLRGGKKPTVTLFADVAAVVTPKTLRRLAFT
jgi:hypothetical protein